MRLDEPQGPAREAILGLWAAARGGRLAHALLFAGPDGVGKFLAAEWLAAGLLCARGPGPPCATCGPCRRLRAGTHADVLVVDAQAECEEEIRISRIVPREDDPRPNVLEFLSLKALEQGWRCVLVREAERMNDESQNALLKTLEEPGERALLVLTCDSPGRLLPTTRSRCVALSFAAPGREVAERALRARGAAPEEASHLSRWGGGAPGTACALHARLAVQARAALADVLGGGTDPWTAAATLSGLAGDFAGRTPTAVARARARFALDLSLEILRDLRRAEAGVDPAGLAHGDLAPLGASLRGAGLERRVEACLLARQDVDANLPPDAVLERFLLALSPGRDPARPRVTTP